MSNFETEVDISDDNDGNTWLRMVQENISSIWYDEEPQVEDLTLEEGEALRAKELNQLSTQEREQVLFELHGVSDVLEEDPEFVDCKLTEFDEEINRISGPHTAYERASLMSPDYVDNVDFRLKFLRGDRFDVEVAAKRFVAYFDQKLELFGPEKLTSDITLTDLDGTDLACLKSGFMQPLPTRDASGRMTLVWIPNLIRNVQGLVKLENRMRALWYIYNAMVDDVEVQKRGFVLVAYLIDLANLDRVGALKQTRLLRSLPVRSVGIHICHNNPFIFTITNLAMLVGGQRSRTHLRVHSGTHVEVQYQLSTFGVPSGVFPISLDGEVSMQNILDMFKIWEKREEEEMDTGSKQVRILVPGPFDVLLGRQKLAQEHQGNLRFRHIVETYREVYENNTSRWEKTNIANKIVEEVKRDHKGRFLKMYDSGWVEVDDGTARDKVSHTFRNRRNAAAVKARNKGNSSRPREIQNTSHVIPSMSVADRDAKRVRIETGFVLSGM